MSDRPMLVTIALLAFVLATGDASGRKEKEMHRESGYVTTPNGARLHYTVVGSGHPVVIVPNAIYMIDDFEVLAGARTMIFYDLRNRGRSDTVIDRAKLERGVHQDVDDLETIRNHFRADRMSLLAHSYPSVIAVLYAMKHPARVERIVQIGPPPADMKKQIPDDLRYVDAVSADVFAKLGSLQQQAGDTDPISLCRRSWTVLRPLYVGRAENAAKLSHWGFCELRNEREMMAHWNRNILPTLQALTIAPEDYARVSMPVLTIHGTRDRNAPYGGGREWTRLLPNARLMTIDGVGHVPYIEEREHVLGAIDRFFDGAWPSEAIELE